MSKDPYEKVRLSGGPLDGDEEYFSTSWEEFAYPMVYFHASERVARAHDRLERKSELEGLSEEEVVEKVGAESEKARKQAPPPGPMTAALYRRSASDRKVFEFVRMLTNEEYRQRTCP